LLEARVALVVEHVDGKGARAAVDVDQIGIDLRDLVGRGLLQQLRHGIALGHGQGQEFIFVEGAADGGRIQFRARIERAVQFIELALLDPGIRRPRQHEQRTHGQQGAERGSQGPFAECHGAPCVGLSLRVPQRRNGSVRRDSPEWVNPDLRLTCKVAVSDKTEAETRKSRTGVGP
jgi:hypothetical protein